MEQIDDCTVRLTDEEMAASDLYENEVVGVDRMIALAAVLRVYPNLSDDFQAYLVE